MTDVSLAGVPAAALAARARKRSPKPSDAMPVMANWTKFRRDIPSQYGAVAPASIRSIAEISLPAASFDLRFPPKRKASKIADTSRF
jgi:hypothetical protein